MLDLVERYIAHCLEAGQTPRHVAQKRSHLRRFLAESGITSLAEIDCETLTHNLAALRDAGLSARTANWRRKIVVAFLNWCVRTKRIKSHAAHHSATYDESDDRRRERRALTDTECVRLLAVADSHGASTGLWYRLALEAGLRKGELARLRWRDVDIDNSILTVRGSKAKRADCVPLLGDTAERLKAFRPAPGAVTPETRVFDSPIGDAARRAHFSAAGVVELDERGRVADLHALRTTLATRLARRGVPPQITQRIMRHSTIAMTLRHYTDLQVDDMRRALNIAAPGPAPVPAPIDPDAMLDAWLRRAPASIPEPVRRILAALLRSEPS